MKSVHSLNLAISAPQESPAETTAAALGWGSYGVKDEEVDDFGGRLGLAVDFGQRRERR